MVVAHLMPTPQFLPARRRSLRSAVPRPLIFRSGVELHLGVEKTHVGMVGSGTVGG